jgi:hypothetical protein
MRDPVYPAHLIANSCLLEIHLQMDAIPMQEGVSP